MGSQPLTRGHAKGVHGEQSGKTGIMASDLGSGTASGIPDWTYMVYPCIRLAEGLLVEYLGA